MAHRKFFKTLILATLITNLLGSAVLAHQEVIVKEIPKKQTDIDQKKIRENVGKMAMPFIQTTNPLSDIKFTSQLPRGNFSVTNDGDLIYKFNKSADFLSFSETFVTTRSVIAEGGERSSTKINSFKGSDSSKWQTDIPAFNTINLGEVFDGIKVHLQARGRNVEKVFTVAPNANPALIKLKIAEADELSIEKGGRLKITKGDASITFTKPIAFQRYDGQKYPVKVSYKLLGDKSYGFELGEYNQNYPLVIDPLLAATFLGSGNYDYTPELYGGNQAMLIATDPNDSQDYVYLVGTVDMSPLPSPLYPTTSGPLGAGGEDDIFVSKLSLDLTTLVSSTRLGGTSNDVDPVIAADASGNIFVGGSTSSTNFPTTAGAYDTTDNAGRDGFVTKLNPALTTMLASTYIGGATSDHVDGLAVNQSTGRVYIGQDVTTATTSSYPVTAGAYDTTANSSGTNVALSSFDNNLSNTAGAYVGTWMGTGGYYPSIGIDSNNNVFVQIACIGSLTDAPAGTAYQPTKNPSCENAVVKMDAAMSTVSASTYFGGAGYESYLTNNLIITPDDSVVIGAETDNATSLYNLSTANPDNLSTTFYCPGNNIANCLYTVFAAKFDNNLTQARVTVIGSDGENGIMLGANSTGDIYAEFSAYAVDIPVTVGAYDETDNDAGDADLVIAKFDSNLTLETASYLGGTEYDSYAFGIDFDANDNVYFYGETMSADFPTVGGEYDTSYNGNNDVFVAKFTPNLTYNDAVTDLISTSVTATEVALYWSPPADYTNITEYEIHYGTAAAGCDPTDINDADCSTQSAGMITSATVSGLTTGDEYLFTVYALGASGTQRSPSSNTVTETPAAGGGGSGSNAEQNITCDTNGAVSISAVTPAVSFVSRSVDFYNETAAGLSPLLDGGLQISVTDTRGYDPGATDCGGPSTLSIQSSGLVNGATTLGLQLGNALTGGALACTSGSCSPATLGDVATVTGSTGTISAAVDIVQFAEAFSGTIRTSLQGDDLQVTPPATVIPTGTYTGTITFTLS